MKSNDIKELHKWLKNLLKEKYINKADIKQILNDFDFEAQQQVKVEPEVKPEIAYLKALIKEARVELEWFQQDWINKSIMGDDINRVARLIPRLKKYEQ